MTVILMTAFSLADSEVKEMVDQAGIDYLINKPLPDMDEFRRTLYRVRDERLARLAKRQQAAQPAPQPVQSPASSDPLSPSTEPPATGQP